MLDHVEPWARCEAPVPLSGRLAFHLLPIRRRIILDNLRRVFGARLSRHRDPASRHGALRSSPALAARDRARCLAHADSARRARARRECRRLPARGRARQRRDRRRRTPRQLGGRDDQRSGAVQPVSRPFPRPAPAAADMAGALRSGPLSPPWPRRLAKEGRIRSTARHVSRPAMQWSSCSISTRRGATGSKWSSSAHRSGRFAVRP